MAEGALIEFVGGVVSIVKVVLVGAAEVFPAVSVVADKLTVAVPSIYVLPFAVPTV